MMTLLQILQIYPYYIKLIIYPIIPIYLLQKGVVCLYIRSF